MHDGGREGALGDLAAFRQEFYGCLTARTDALFELAEAVLRADGPVLPLAPAWTRALCDAVNCGRIDFARLHVVLAGCRCRGRLMAVWCWRGTCRRGCRTWPASADPPWKPAALPRLPGFGASLAKACCRNDVVDTSLRPVRAFTIPTTDSAATASRKWPSFHDREIGSQTAACIASAPTVGGSSASARKIKSSMRPRA
ncbi:hypothetical protein [Amycolatopsis sp. cmx-11-12]|uniref:hypothetical protein n=1 Tax=Amycolatopsis sp. cmx-11-12 TaxID=2785795 RepID=UPI0039172FD1